MTKRIWQSIVAAALVAGCHTTAPQGTPCSTSTDCMNQTVCRSGMCAQVPCSQTMACMAGETCTAGMCVPSSGMNCTKSSDCPPAVGVCRMMKCAQVPCSVTMPCLGDEQCVGGNCRAPAPETPGHTLAAGGSVSTSGKHIHIGLTGQGRAVGTGTSAQHSHTTGATSVMRRQ